MSYLLIVSIGPVQEFIASARRSRDLWFGSWLLSELSKAAARRIVAEQGSNLNCLIFPRPETIDDLNEDSTFNVVNRIVALIDKSPDEIGKAAYESLIERLRGVRDKAFREIKDKAHHFHLAVAKMQVDDFIEYSWAAASLDDPNDPAQYTRSRNMAETLLAGRKTTRDFKQVLPQPEGWAANVPKSSLDGLRESAIDEKAYDELGAPELRQQYGVRKGERLCGVGLLKRHGNRSGDDGFFSTSHVAALPLLTRLTDQQAVTDYVRELTALRGVIDERELVGRVPARAAHPVFRQYDGHLLFEGRLSEFFEGANLDGARKSLERFLSRALNCEQPNPYYALLLADGDRMGKAIDEQRDIDHHRKLSEQLAKFATSVRDIVEKDHQGSLVYSGGDDVLAFVPLHTALQCARRLAQRFKADLNEFRLSEGDDEGNRLTPTLSVGIAISHHIEPLSDALYLARKAEKIAKDAGRNALAITLSKRSGVDRTVKGHWNKIDERLDRFVWLHRAEAVPDGAAYELHDLALRLEGVKRAALNSEAVRILKRKRAEEGQRPLADSVLNELKQFIEDPDLTIEQLADELIIAREFASATSQAGISLEALSGAPSAERPVATAPEDKQ